jgi:hypothetical protein
VQSSNSSHCVRNSREDFCGGTAESYGDCYYASPRVRGEGTITSAWISDSIVLEGIRRSGPFYLRQVKVELAA